MFTSRRRAGLIVGALMIAVPTAAVLAPTAPSAQAQLTKPKDVVVELKSLKFRPDKIKIKVGTKVNFVWRENVAHNVIFKDKKMSSKVLNKGTYSYTFTKTGTFKYDCTLHPGMKGEVKVEK
jgi:plastocyanin